MKPVLGQLASKFNLDVPKDFSQDKKLKFQSQDSNVSNPQQNFQQLSNRLIICQFKISQYILSNSEPGTRRQGSLNEKLNQINNSKHLSRLSEMEQQFFKNMGGFVDSYFDIYMFSREKIEQELHKYMGGHPIFKKISLIFNKGN